MSAGGLARPTLIAAAATALVAGLGARATDLGDWYRGLVQPAWKPPDWAFGPAWTTIFTLAAASGVIGWRSAPDPARRRTLVRLFAANGALNVFWSVIYFRLRRPDWALVEVVFLWLSVLLLMVVVGRWSLKASALLAPYLGWVAFAGALNWSTVRLNGPFGG